MRRALAVVLLVAAAVPAAHAQDRDAGLVAALAPVQTFVDAAGELVSSALREAKRDGTPDDAIELRGLMENYSANLSRDWQLPDNATYREEVLASLPFVPDVFGAVANVTQDAATAAVWSEQCEIEGALPPDTGRELALALANLNATATRLTELVELAPDGIDTAPLSEAAAIIASWTTEIWTTGCFTAPPDEPKFRYLTLRIAPASTWPGGRVTAIGATSEDGSVRLEASAIGLDALAPIHRGGFAHAFALGRDAPLGTTTVKAAVGDLTAEASFLIAKAPSELTVSGPSSMRPGAGGTLHVRLSSPLRDITDQATIHVTDGATMDLALRGGAASMTVVAPETPGRYRYVFTYDGTAIVAGDTAIFEVVVIGAGGASQTPTTPGGSNPPTTGPTGPLSDGPLAPLAPILAGMVSWLWLILLILLLIAIAVATWRWLARRRSAAKIVPGPIPRPPPAAAPTEGPEPLGSGLVALFSGIVRLLVRRGDATPAMTAREIGVHLETRGVPIEGLVTDFERIRYGRAAEPEPLADRALAWARRAWERLGGRA